MGKSMKEEVLLKMLRWRSNRPDEYDDANDENDENDKNKVVLTRQVLDPYFKWTEACSVGTTKLQSFLLRAKDRAMERHYRPGASGFQAKRKEWESIINSSIDKMN